MYADEVAGGAHSSRSDEPAPDLFGGLRPTLAIIGAGRCGTALAASATAAGYRVTVVHSRTAAHARALAERARAGYAATPLAAVHAADLTLLTVPDPAIIPVAATLAASGTALRGRALVHCSGSLGAAALASLRQAAASIGAVHPLQALSDAGSGETLAGTFFAVEGDAPLVPVLERFVVDLGGVPFAAPFGDRALYHAAAVLAGNAPLALLARASALLERAGVDPAVATQALATLLEGAARNTRRLGPQRALTGPVARNDAATVRRHLEVLADDPATQRLYHRMARETLRTVGLVGREEVAAVLGATPVDAPGRTRRRPTAAVRIPLGAAHV